jgi:hypothetical protein
MALWFRVWCPPAAEKLAWRFTVLEIYQTRRSSNKHFTNHIESFYCDR